VLNEDITDVFRGPNETLSSTTMLFAIFANANTRQQQGTLTTDH
jgi:hypothetical protein